MLLYCVQCMLHYKSGLLQSLSTLFFSLPMLTGFLEEKQIVPVQLHENYIEDSVSEIATKYSFFVFLWNLSIV